MDLTETLSWLPEVGSKMSSETQPKYVPLRITKIKLAPRPSSSEIRYRVMKTVEIMKEKNGQVPFSWPVLGKRRLTIAENSCVAKDMFL